MTMLAFTLSMPGCASWNGEWTGEGTLYAIVRSGIKPEKADELSGYYSYSFGDGWRAAVNVDIVSPGEARKIRKRADGFCGYDWMVSELLELGRIRTLEERVTK